MMCFGGRGHFTIFSNLSFSTFVFSSGQAVLISLPIFFYCFYCLTFSMTSSTASCLLLQIPCPADIWPCPALLPTQTLIQGWLICPFSDCPEIIWMAMKEEWEQKKRVFLPSLLELPRHRRETIIRNEMLLCSEIANLEHTHYR